MRDPNDVYIQVELRENQTLAYTGHNIQVVWIPAVFKDKKIRSGMVISLVGDSRHWEITRTFTTMPRAVIEANREWKAGGVESFHP
jgi:hypothetical protein